MAKDKALASQKQKYGSYVVPASGAHGGTPVSGYQQVEGHSWGDCDHEEKPLVWKKMGGEVGFISVGRRGKNSERGDPISQKEVNGGQTNRG